MRRSPSELAAGEVVLILDAGTDAGCLLAHSLLEAGNRVVVTSRHANRLIPVLHGRPSDRIMAIVADVNDPRQCRQLLDRVEVRFGRVTSIRTAAGTDAGRRPALCPRPRLTDLSTHGPLGIAS